MVNNAPHHLYKYQGVNNFTLMARLGGEMQHFMQFSVATHKLCTFDRAQLTCSIQCEGI